LQIHNGKMPEIIESVISVGKFSIYLYLFVLKAVSTPSNDPLLQ